MLELALRELREKLSLGGGNIGNPPRATWRRHRRRILQRRRNVYLSKRLSCNEFKSLQMFCISGGLGPRRMSLSLKGWQGKKFCTLTVHSRRSLTQLFICCRERATRDSRKDFSRVRIGGKTTQTLTFLAVGQGERMPQRQRERRTLCVCALLCASIVRILRPTARR